MFRTAEDVMNFISDNDIEMIDFRMTDINGRWHHLTIPAKRFSEDTMKNGIGFDGSNYGFVNKCHKLAPNHSATNSMLLPQKESNLR